MPSLGKSAFEGDWSRGNGPIWDYHYLYNPSYPRLSLVVDVEAVLLGKVANQS